MERAHKSNPSALLVLLATAFVVAAVWAATALAGGDSSSASTDPGSRPAVEFVQVEEDAAPREDCREEDGSGGSEDSSGSSSTDF